MLDKKKISQEVFNMMFEPKWEDEVRQEKTLKDIEWTLSFIIQSHELNNEKILFNFYLWFKKIFQTYHLELKYLNQMFNIFKKHLKEKYDYNVDYLIDALPFDEEYTPITLIDNQYDQEMKHYLNLVLDSKRSEAKDYIHNLVNQSVPIQDIYLFIFQESLRVVGEMWLKGEVSVAMEHYFTAATQYIMSTLYDYVISEQTSEKRVLACAVGSELHEVGIRMVADLFELDGWDSRYLGASVPILDMVKYAQDFKPHIIALSITMGYHVSDLKDVVNKLKDVSSLKETKIIVGGLPFIGNEELFKQMGADAYSVNAVDGIRLANELV